MDERPADAARRALRAAREQQTRTPDGPADHRKHVPGDPAGAGNRPGDAARDALRRAVNARRGDGPADDGATTQDADADESVPRSEAASGGPVNGAADAGATTQDADAAESGPRPETPSGTSAVGTAPRRPAGARLSEAVRAVDADASVPRSEAASSGPGDGAALRWSAGARSSEAVRAVDADESVPRPEAASGTPGDGAVPRPPAGARPSDAAREALRGALARRAARAEATQAETRAARRRTPAPRRATPPAPADSPAGTAAEHDRAATHADAPTGPFRTPPAALGHAANAGGNSPTDQGCPEPRTIPPAPVSSGEDLATAGALAAIPTAAWAAASQGAVAGTPEDAPAGVLTTTPVTPSDGSPSRTPQDGGSVASRADTTPTSSGDSPNGTPQEAAFVAPSVDTSSAPCDSSPNPTPQPRTLGANPDVLLVGTEEWAPAATSDAASAGTSGAPSAAMRDSASAGTPGAPSAAMGEGPSAGTPEVPSATTRDGVSTGAPDASWAGTPEAASAGRRAYGRQASPSPSPSSAGAGSGSASFPPARDGAEPPVPPRVPRSMASYRRDGELRRTFPAFPARAVEGGRFAETWWGDAWVDALEEGALDAARLARGRGYAQTGHVDAVTVTPGLVLAYVQGSRPRPYRVQVRLRTLDDADWDRFLDAVAERPGHIAALLDKEMPQSLADCGVPLLPGPGDLEPHCSCPDHGHPCKHAAALCYQTARLLDADPFVLLLLRGRGERELLDALSRLNASRAARAAQEREPEPFPGVRAGEALAERRRPPLPAPLPAPPHPEQPPVYPAAPGGPDPFALDQLATDAAARAHALLTTGRDPVGGLTLWQDAVRLAAARPGSGLTAATRSLYASLASATGRGTAELARAVAAWRQGGPEGLAVLEEPWDPPAGRFDRARPLLLAADLPAFRPWRNRLTHPRCHLQLRLGRDGLWYAYESEPDRDDWWPRGTPDLDPVGALTGLGAPGAL